MAKKIAIVLSGCGVKDGSEIHESVLTLLHTVNAGATPLFYAPRGNQSIVVDHMTGDTVTESRTMIVEAARIARGEISFLEELTPSEADGVIFPGGFGAALNLSTFGKDGSGCTVNPEVEKVVMSFHSAGKPQGFICIAPAIAARVLGNKGVELTIGNDPSTASALESMGAKHINKTVTEIHVDQANKVVSTPAYMLARNIAEANEGIAKLVSAVLEMA
ncbi:MAG: isoprenoid biosynthesis protein ElbB [Candidatus Dadabacteria bacterium]|nr:MAG: isoprenoid biosynthesis protein ElbB [Candidatus Dadabacteria bacterium]